MSGWEKLVTWFTNKFFFLNTVFRCHFEISQDAVGFNKAMDLKQIAKQEPVSIGTETSHLKEKTKWKDREFQIPGHHWRGNISAERYWNECVYGPNIYKHLSRYRSECRASTSLGRFVSRSNDQECREQYFTIIWLFVKGLHI